MYRLALDEFESALVVFRVGILRARFWQMRFPAGQSAAITLSMKRRMR